MINDAKCTRKIKYRISNSVQLEEESFHQQILPKFKEELMKCYIWNIALHGAETWTLRKVDQKYLERF